jgi:hypothetical protein
MSVYVKRELSGEYVWATASTASGEPERCEFTWSAEPAILIMGSSIILDFVERSGGYSKATSKMAIFQRREASGRTHVEVRFYNANGSVEDSGHQSIFVTPLV